MLSFEKECTLEKYYWKKMDKIWE